MTLSRGAIGNLVNRYRAVLRKCRMMNVFGSLAVAGMLVAGNAGFAGAEELSGDISPISLSGDTRNIIGVGDISLRSTEPALRYLINVSGQGQLDISMSNGSSMAVGHADGIYLKDYSDYDQYASAFHVAGSGSSGSFVGTGTFSMVGGGKLLGVCAFLSESKGTLTLSGDITGEAEAVMNGSNGYASFAAAAAGGNLVFGGDRTTLRAKASTGNNANGAFVKYGGMIDFASKSVLIESKNTDSSSVGINCADGTVKTSADTDLDIVVEGNKATTGIQLTASSSDVQLAGNLDLTATQTGQDSFASVLGISNDSGKMVVSGPTSLRLATNAPFDAKGITASGKADMSFLGDVEIAVTGSASGSALYTAYRYDYSTQAGICPVISLGTDGKAVTLNSSGYGINNQGGSVSLTGQRINITGSTGVFVEGGGNENVFADVRFDGPTTINADKAIVTSIKAGEQVGASVTFAYNPTPINVPVTKESADSKVRGSVTGSSGTINKENAGSLAFYGDISNFSGVFNQKGGTTFLSEGAAGYFGKAQLAVTGGALVAPTLSFQKTGKLTLAGGTLETGTGQIFTSALNADGDMKDPGAVKLSDSNWKFDSGVIAFDDAKYNIVYAQTAAGLLGAGNVAADNVSGSGSAKEITFTGTLVELPPGDPDSFETLQKAVLDTGIDSIKLGSDIVLSKRLQGTTPVARSLAIDGNGHTISGAYPGLWFKGMDSGTVSIQNIAFDGLKTSSGDRYEGPVSFGPAIFFDMGYFADNWKSTAKLIIGDGVQFRNTESVGDGAGGAVRTAHGIVEIGNNVGFINCTGGSGGGLYSESFTTIGDNVVFEGNKGRRGGALNVVDDYGGYLTDPDYASGARRVKYVHIGKNALFKNNSVELLGSGGNGGAIEVQSGELSIDDGATFTGNTSKSTGGAIAVCDWSPQLPAKAVLGSAAFTQNSAGSYGGAIINEGDVRFNGPVSFVENTAGKIGGAVCNLNTLNMAAESTFSKNTAGVGGGFYNEGIASLGKASFIENAAADGGGAVFNVHQLTFADGAVFSGNSATDGGAVYNYFTSTTDGSLAFNGGARFTGNTASGLGGAIYNTRSITLNPGAGQEIVFSGNTDSTGSNAIFMGDGSSLDITGDGKVVFDDALSSQSATPALKKTGSGELLLNASMGGFLGTASFEGGLTSIAEKWLIKNLVTIAGGKLKMPEFSFAPQDAENAVTGGKLVLAGGILETGTGQIFANGLNAEGDARNPGSVKLNGDNWSFDSGLIAFDDTKYNLTYAQAAALLLGASNVGAEASGSGSAKEITFTGTLVALPPGDPDSFETLQKAVLDTGIDSIKLGSDIVLSKRLQGTTPVARSLAIDGNGHTISGAYPGLWFKGMDSGTVSIQNIAFDGLKTSSGDRYEGPVSFGPAIFFDMGYFADNWKSTAKLIIGDGVQFRNTESVGDGAGGAVRTAHGIVEIGNNVGFINCTGGSGGGLYSESFTTIGDNVVFEGNKGRRGGALNVVDDYGGYLTDPDYASGARRVKYVHIGKNALFKNNSVELLGSGGNGGAIEVQSGELSIDDGATFTGNTSKSTGGAIAVCDWSPQLPAKAVLGSAAFTQNSAGSYGGAIINEGDVRFNGPVSFVENTAGKIGGAVCNLNTLNMAAESTFSKNTAGVGGGFYNEGIASLGKASFIENAAADGGGAVFNVHQLTFADGAVFSGNSATDGGAVYNYFTSTTDGSLAFNGGARFTGNTASGLGGAIYNTRSITLNPGAGQEIVFSGNTDSTGSNAIFMGDGSSLDITGDGKVVFDDALSSQSATPALKKTGSGELLLNASMDGFLGTAAFEDGRTEIPQKWLIKNTVTITGGRLKMPAFSFVAQGEGNNVAGGKLILAGGILETGTGQIFINGLNAEGDNKDPGAVKLSGDNWSFDSGLIAFNDALYNLTYAQAAADSLGANNVEAGEGAGSTSAKEITFIGTGYVDPGPDPVPPVEPDPTPPAPEPKPDEDRTGKVSVDELNNNHANNIVLGNVTITTGTSSDSGKDFVVGASAKDDKTDSISGSIGGKNIDLGSSGRNISVVGGHYLTLVGGSSDTPLVTAGGNPVNVHVGGTGEGASGVLNLGTPVMDSGGTLSGNIEIAAASTVNVRAGTHVITGEANETTGTADVAGMNNNGGTINIAEGAHLQSTIRQADGQTNVSGKLTSASVELSGGALNVSGAVDSSSVTASKGDIKVAGTLAADVLTTSSDVQLNIGDQGSAGRVVARQAQLQGGRVFLDPAWKGNDALADASHGVFTFVNNEIDGLLTAGQNSLLVLGDTDTGWALDAFGRSSLQWGQNGVTAALAIRKPQTLNGTLGAVMVDGTKTSAPVLTPNTATFADGSLLLVDGSGLNGAAALTSQGGTLNVDAGAKLLIDNITQGEYAITSGFSVSNVQGWNGDNLSTPDNLIGLVLGKDADGSMKVQATARRSSDVFRGLSLVNTMDAIWGKGLNDTESGNMGIRFLSRAVNENHLPKADTVHTVDGAAQIAVAGGVQGMAVAAADAPVRAIQDHASLSHMTTTREGAIRKDGLNLWINALYGAEHARNLGAGSLDGGYNADFGGIVFGGDYAFGDFRVGMALNAGSGTARSRGDFNATKNDFDFWGMNLYGSWSRDQFNIVGDLGYSANKNEVKQDLPTTMQLGQLRADVDTGVLTAGLRGEYRFETDWADVTPHVGVRYYNLRTDGFTSRIDDHDVFRVGRDTQEIWTFPIGVSFSRDFETSSGWKVKPRADLSVAPAAGDLKAKAKARVPGVAASDTIKARMMDSVSFDGTLGLEVQKDNISFGLDYGIRASEHKAGHGVNVSFTYKF